MSTQSTARTRFVRRTQLSPDEYHKNFYKLDRDAIAVVSSAKADRVTRQMSKVYLRLVDAPQEYWEREGILRFGGEEREGEWVTAWEQLISLLGVASATARKALKWMSEQGVIGYSAHKNGAGIRIFMNRASSSIGQKPASNQKNLRLVRTSPSEPHTSTVDMPFKDSFAVLEVSDTDMNPAAPKNGADTEPSDKKAPDPTPSAPADSTAPRPDTSPGANTPPAPRNAVTIENVVTRLKAELEPTILAAARQAAAREHERTREWLENRGLPKAARVAQREAYNVLRSYGVIKPVAERARADLEVGRPNSVALAKPLTEAEVKEFAELCIAMLETHGQSIDTTLAEISSETGGCLLPEDVPRVRALAESMLQESNS